MSHCSEILEVDEQSYQITAIATKERKGAGAENEETKRKRVVYGVILDGSWLFWWCRAVDSKGGVQTTQR